MDIQEDESLFLKEGIALIPNPMDIRRWRALIYGPKGSPYENGVFILRIKIPSHYP